MIKHCESRIRNFIFVDRIEGKYFQSNIINSCNVAINNVRLKIFYNNGYDGLLIIERYSGTVCVVSSHLRFFHRRASLCTSRRNLAAKNGG